MKEELNINRSTELNDSSNCEFSNDSLKEWQGYTENKTPSENLQKSEFDFSEPKKTAKRNNGKNKNGLINKILSFVIAGVSVGVVAVVIPPADGDARFLSVESTDASIKYNLEVDEKGTDLVLILKNPNTEREIDLINGENVGEIFGLKPNMEYVLSVREKSGKKTAVDDYNVKTLPHANQSTWYGVDYHPAKDKNGTFRFTPYFYNKDGEWKNLELLLIDGNEYMASVLLDEPGKEYVIDLSEYKFTSSKGEFRVYAQNDNGDFLDIFELLDVNIMETGTYWKGFTYVYDSAQRKLEIIPSYVDENDLWGDISLRVYDDEWQSIGPFVMGDSGEKFIVEIPEDFIFEQTLYIEFLVKVDFYGDIINAFICDERISVTA